MPDEGHQSAGSNPGYKEQIADAASRAGSYVSEKMVAAGSAIKQLRNRDMREVAAQAKDYARRKPGQALMISAGAGFALGLLLRGARR